jgi:hypothetical protein
LQVPDGEKKPPALSLLAKRLRVINWPIGATGQELGECASALAHEGRKKTAQLPVWALA